MAHDIRVATIGVMIAVMALVISLRTHLRSDRTAKPDPERLRRFFETVRHELLMQTKEDTPDAAAHPQHDGKPSWDEGFFRNPAMEV